MLLPMVLGAVGVWRASAQVAGFAELHAPQTGQILEGPVPIVGTAAHPDFESYQLEFAYDPNPTGTWFPLTDPIRQVVQDSRLALWQTDGLSAGSYQLRLTVLTGQGQRLTAAVDGLTIGDGGPGVVAATQAPPTDLPATPTALALAQTAQSVAGQAERPATPRQILGRLLALGAGTAGLAMVGFGLYTWLRPHVRNYYGLLRMRQIHRRRPDRERGPD